MMKSIALVSIAMLLGVGLAMPAAATPLSTGSGSSAGSGIGASIGATALGQRIVSLLHQVWAQLAPGGVLLFENTAENWPTALRTPPRAPAKDALPADARDDDYDEVGFAIETDG